MVNLWIKGSMQDALSMSEKLNMPLLTAEEYEPASGYKMVSRPRVLSPPQQHRLRLLRGRSCTVSHLA